MRPRSIAWVVLFALSVGLTLPVSAQKFQKTAMDGWISKWLGMELVINTGGFAVSAGKDYISEGTGGKQSHTTISTTAGLAAVKEMVVKLDKNLGGDRRWKVITINVDDQNNMSTSWAMADQSNITWHGIIVIKSPSDREVTGHFAHDDHAQVWVNGKSVYDNSQWTGAVKNTRPAKMQLKKGDNVLLFKCGESGGADYVNLHFEDTEKDLNIAPTTDDKFWEYAGLAVEPQDKLSVTWGYLKGKK